MPCHRRPSWAVVVLLVLTCAGMAAATVGRSYTGPLQAPAQDCKAQLTALGSTATGFIDPATPFEACAVQRCTKYVADPGEKSVCDVESPDLSSMQLVFSDEFNAEGRDFGVGAKDPRWTAERLW